jgi:3-oxoacyl-[acyl-carrier-protein] synthase II
LVMGRCDVVVTGIGIVSPLGVGKRALCEGILAGRSGVGHIKAFDASSLPVRIAAEVKDFDPAAYVTRRKAIKLMSRDAQLAVAAARLACDDASICNGEFAPERLGVIFGADTICAAVEEAQPMYQACVEDGKFHLDRWAAGMSETFPLMFLRLLPNMVSSHVAIAVDARGPNNCIVHAEISSLLAIQEAVRALRWGIADAIIAGGSSAQINPIAWLRQCVCRRLSRRNDAPEAAARPFDADRDGEIRGEGACALVLEPYPRARARGATILASILGSGTSYVSDPAGGRARWLGLRQAIGAALADAGLHRRDIGHISAQGLSSVEHDAIEARILNDILPGVPVTAPKSFFGNLGAAGGAVETAANILMLGSRLIPPTLNYTTRDPNCPVPVVHSEPARSHASTALVVNSTLPGQAAAIILGGN